MVSIKTKMHLQVMISFPVQLFIAWRVKVMSKSSVLPVIIAFFAIASLGKSDSMLHRLFLSHLYCSWWYLNHGYRYSHQL